MRSPTNSAQASGPRATRAHWLLAPLLTLVISGVQAQTPEPADRDFAAGFPMLTDSEHALPLGGFGGTPVTSHRGSGRDFAAPKPAPRPLYDSAQSA